MGLRVMHAGLPSTYTPSPAQGLAQRVSLLETKSAHLAKLAHTLLPHPMHQAASLVRRALFRQQEVKISAKHVCLALHSPAVARLHVQFVQAEHTRDNQGNARACRALLGSLSQRIDLLVEVWS